MALEIFKLMGSIFVDSTDANKNIEKTDKKAESLGSKIGKVTKKAAAFGVGLAGAATVGTAALYGIADKAAGTADEIDKMSAKIGISKQSYQEWGYVLGQNGMDINMLQTGMKTLVSKMDSASDGTKSACEAFDKLGVSIYDSNGKLKDQQTMLNESMYALADMENGTEKARLATELFGKSGIEMMPMLNQGSEGMKELTERSHELGLIMSDEAVNAGVVLGDTMDDVKQSLGAVATKVGVEVMPVIQSGLNFVLDHMPQIQSVCSAFFGAIQTAIEFLSPIISGLFSAVFDGFTGSEGVVSSVFESIKGMYYDIIQPLFDAFQPALQALFDNFRAIWEGISTLFQTAWDIIVSIWDTVGKPLFDIICEGINILSGVFAEIMPSISALFRDVCDTFTSLWEEILKPVFDAIKQIIETVLAPIFEKYFKLIGENVKTTFELIKELWEKSLKPIFAGITEFISGVFTGNWKKAWEGVSKIFKGIFDGLVTIAKTPINLIIGVINGMINGVCSGINTIIKAVNKLSFDIPDWIPGIGGKTFGFNLSEVTAPQIPKLAEGGIVDEGQLFIAREKGAELVGSDGKGNTAVMNNEQIIESVSDGVYRAVREAMGDNVINYKELAKAMSKVNLSVGIDPLFNAMVNKNDENTKRTGKNRLATA